MPNRSTSSKAEAGRARKAEQESLKKAQEDDKREAALAKDWEKGADLRGQAKRDEAATKADEAARKRKEKAELEAAEKAALGSGGKLPKNPSLARKGRGSKKDDLSLLEDALISEAEKKARAKRRSELLRKEQEEAAAKAKAEKQASETLDPLLQNTEAMLEGADGGREANIQAMEEAAESGLDAALESFGISGGDEPKSQRALYLAFEEKMLPIVKEEHPGLRLSQYKEKIFNQWKKSPENPQNQIT